MEQLFARVLRAAITHSRASLRSYHSILVFCHRRGLPGPTALLALTVSSSYADYSYKAYHTNHQIGESRTFSSVVIVVVVVVVVASIR